MLLLINCLSTNPHPPTHCTLLLLPTACAAAAGDSCDCCAPCERSAFQLSCQLQLQPCKLLSGCKLLTAQPPPRGHMATKTLQTPSYMLPCHHMMSPHAERCSVLKATAPLLPAIPHTQEQSLSPRCLPLSHLSISLLLSRPVFGLTCVTWPREPVRPMTFITIASFAG